MRPATMKLLASILMLIWICAIFTLSSQSTQPILFGDYNYVCRKIAHVIEFSGLFLVSYWTSSIFPAKYQQRYSLAILFSIVCACFDEIHQTFVLDRTGCFSDVLLDSSAILVTALAYFVVRTQRQLAYVLRKSRSSGRHNKFSSPNGRHRNAKAERNKVLSR